MLKRPEINLKAYLVFSPFNKLVFSASLSVFRMASGQQNFLFFYLFTFIVFTAHFPSAFSLPDVPNSFRSLITLIGNAGRRRKITTTCNNFRFGYYSHLFRLVCFYKRWSHRWHRLVSDTNLPSSYLGKCNFIIW